MEVDNLSMDNILGQEEIESLFTQDSPEEDPKDQVKDNEDPKEDNKDENKEETTEVNPDELFDLPESVGSGKEDKKEVKIPPLIRMVLLQIKFTLPLPKPLQKRVSFLTLMMRLLIVLKPLRI